MKACVRYADVPINSDKYRYTRNKNIWRSNNKLACLFDLWLEHRGTEGRDLNFAKVFFFFLTKDPRGLQPICSLSAGSDGNLLLLPPQHTRGQRMRVEFVHLSIIICSSLKRYYFLPPLCTFLFFSSFSLPMDSQLWSRRSLMMIYEHRPEDVVRSQYGLWVRAWVVMRGG